MLYPERARSRTLADGRGLDLPGRTWL